LSCPDWASSRSLAHLSSLQWQEELLFAELQSESFNVDHSNVIEVREWRFAVQLMALLVSISPSVCIASAPFDGVSLCPCLQFTAPLQSGLYAMCLVLIATARETATYVRGEQLGICWPHFPLSRDVCRWLQGLIDVDVGCVRVRMRACLRFCSCPCFLVWT
jgi:hypothetical protein